MSEKNGLLLEFFFVVVRDCFGVFSFCLLVSHYSLVLKSRLTSSFDNHSMFYFPEREGE